MTDPGYAGGVVLLVLTITSFTVGAVALRVWLLPAWSGAPARLAEAVLGVAALVAVSEALGVLHAFRLLPEMILASAVGISGAVYLHRQRGSSQLLRPCVPPARDSLAAGAAVVATAVVAANWAARIKPALAHGMPNVDTLWYHMPFAARFAQDGSFDALSLTQPDPLTTFYPANAELVHAVGILLFGHDTLSPVLNLGWLALALLAAWCIGRPFGAPAASLLGVTVVAGSYLMTYSQAGDASNDMVGLALFLASVALVLNADDDNRALALAAVPAGLALGTKVSLVAPVLAFFVALIVLARPAMRRRLAVSWLVTLAIVGGFWYARNLVATGNPLPWVKLGVAGFALPTTHADPLLQAPETGFGSTVAHLLSESHSGGIIRGGLRYDLGPAWWAILAVAGAGLLASSLNRGNRLARVLGITGLVAAAAYMVTPQSGSSFTPNVRHLTPALALGLALLPTLPRFRTPTGQRACLIVLAILFGMAQMSSRLRPADHRNVWLAAAIGVAGLATAIAFMRRRPSGRLMLAGSAVVLAIGAAVTGYYVQRDYLRNRYADPGARLLEGNQPGQSLLRVYAWARGIHHAKIGLTGTQLQYPLLGLDLSNRVRYVHHSRDHGRVVQAIHTCIDWRRALVAQRPRYLVITPVRFPFNLKTIQPREAIWTRSLPGVSELANNGGQIFVFRIDRPPRAGGCAGARVRAPDASP